MVLWLRNLPEQTPSEICYSVRREKQCYRRLLLRKLALETRFNIFATQRVSCFGQQDRIDDFIASNLRGDKRPISRQFLVDELHLSAVSQERRVQMWTDFPISPRYNLLIHRTQR